MMTLILGAAWFVTTSLVSFETRSSLAGSHCASGVPVVMQLESGRDGPARTALLGYITRSAAPEISMFENLIWQKDRLLYNGLVFRLQHYKSDDWELGDECFI